MQLKILLKPKLLIVVLTGCILTATFFFFFFQQNSIQNNLAPLTTNLAFLSEQEQARSLLPVGLKIPRTNVDATVEYVGLAKDGSVGVPSGPDNVAWFNLSPRPGEIGSSIIDGHAGYKNNRPAVFDNLYKLQQGDKIYIEDGKGVTITFVVREFKRYNAKANPEEVFISNDGKAHLNLITCTGNWNAIEKTHSERLVVFTDKEIE